MGISDEIRDKQNHLQRSLEDDCMSCSEEFTKVEVELDMIKKDFDKHLQRHEPILQHLQDTTTRMRENIHTINNTLTGLVGVSKINFDEIKEKLDDLGRVRIYNGGGREILFKRDEFHQKTYDMFRFKGVLKIIITLAGLTVALLTIVNFFIEIHK